MGTGRRNDLRKGRSGSPVRRVLFAWLAVCALLIQSIVPELAMAARDAPERRIAVTGTHAPGMVAGHGAHEHHESHDCGTTEPDRQPPPGVHDSCPFCFVQSLQVLPADGGRIASPSVAVPLKVTVRDAVPLVARQFLTCLHPRAPPQDDTA